MNYKQSYNITQCIAVALTDIVTIFLEFVEGKGEGGRDSLGWQGKILAKFEIEGIALTTSPRLRPPF